MFPISLATQLRLPISPGHSTVGSLTQSFANIENSSTSLKEGMTHTERLENVDFASQRVANNLCGSLGQT